MQEKPLPQQIADMKAQMRMLIEQDPDKVQYTFQVSLADLKVAYMAASTLSTEMRKHIIVEKEQEHE